RGARPCHGAVDPRADAGADVRRAQPGARRGALRRAPHQRRNAARDGSDMTALRRSAKRAIDLLGAAAGLIALAPVLLLIGLAVRLLLGSPVRVRQVRAGGHGKPFELLKFRTMTDARDEAGELLPDEARLTRFGSWLRSTSLDELPELINVLRGDMSLVGPRPLLPDYLPHYSAEQARRHEVRPGITGWSVVQGRNALSWA